MVTEPAEPAARRSTARRSTAPAQAGLLDRVPLTPRYRNGAAAGLFFLGPGQTPPMFDPQVHPTSTATRPGMTDSLPFLT